MTLGTMAQAIAKAGLRTEDQIEEVFEKDKERVTAKRKAEAGLDGIRIKISELEKDIEKVAKFPDNDAKAEVLAEYEDKMKSFRQDRKRLRRLISKLKRQIGG